MIKYMLLSTLIVALIMVVSAGLIWIRIMVPVYGGILSSGLACLIMANVIGFLWWKMKGHE